MEEEEEEGRGGGGEGGGGGGGRGGKGKLYQLFPPGEGGRTEGGGGESAALRVILEREQSIPLWKPALLTLCFLGILVLDVLKGGEGTPSPLGFACGSLGYWVVTLSAIPWVSRWVGGWVGGWVADLFSHLPQ